MSDNSDREKFYTSYWEGFKQFALPSNPNLFDHEHILYKQYFGFPCYMHEARIALNAPKTEKLRCELVLDNVKRRRLLLEILECREKLIANGLKVNLASVSFNYDQVPRRVCVHSDYFSHDDATRNDQYKWMLGMLRRFQGYFPAQMAMIYKFLDI